MQTTFTILSITKTRAYARRAFLLLAISSFLFITTAFADGDSRLATQAEKNFTKSVLQVFAKAVPPGPEGWDQTGETTVIEELKRVVTGAEERPLPVEYCVAWQDTKGMMKGQELLNTELQKLMKGPAENITEKNIEEMNMRVTPHDVKVRVDIYANSLYLGFYEKVTPAPAMAGGLVYRSQGEYRDGSVWREGTTYVFLGKNWKLINNAGTYMETKAVKGLPHTTVQTIVIKVHADPDRARQLLQKFDWEALKKLIKN